jgi:hypothetical protein
MPAKVTERATDYREIDRWADGVGWLAHPEETMERASHALTTEAGVYLVDPVDAAGVEELVEDLDGVVGVVVLSNYHSRDATAFADRHDVPVYLPDGLDEVVTGVEVERFSGRLPGSGYTLLPVDVSASWQEYALFDGETLYVSESVGTADYFRVGDERLGVLTLRRLSPPREALGGLQPERLLVGHGEGIHRDATVALSDALVHSRARFPRALLENGLDQLRTVTAAVRT